MKKDVMTANKLTGSQVAHMMHITDVAEGDYLLFKENQHHDLVAIRSFDETAFIGRVLSAPVKGFAGYYEFKTDLHENGYQHHLSDLIAIVKDLLTEQQRNSVNGLINTSADDCRVSLNYITDSEVLIEALRLTTERGYKTQSGHIQRRINKLSKIK